MTVVVGREDESAKTEDEMRRPLPRGETPPHGLCHKGGNTVMCQIGIRERGLCRLAYRQAHASTAFAGSHTVRRTRAQPLLARILAGTYTTFPAFLLLPLCLHD